LHALYVLRNKVSDRLELIDGEIYRCCIEVLLDVSEARRAWNGQHPRRAVQQPRDCELRHADAVPIRDRTESIGQPICRMSPSARNSASVPT
jgi:hypothetical protein